MIKIIKIFLEILIQEGMIDEYIDNMDDWAKDKDGQPQVLENYEIIDLNSGGFKLRAGGDWQDAKTMHISFIVPSDSYLDCFMHIEKVTDG